MDTPTSQQIEKVNKLRRSRENRLIGGICGGLGEYFGIDPIIFRLVFAVLFLTGIGILPYILFWIFIPDNTDQPKLQHHSGTMEKILKGLLIFIFASIAIAILYGIFK